MRPTNTEDELDAALEFFEIGEIGRAEMIAQQVLQREPDSVFALHLLGVIAARTDRLEMAIELLRRAIAVDPEYGEPLNDLGHVLRLEGRIPEAIDLLERACQRGPDSAAAHNTLGEAYVAAGRSNDAEQCFRNATRLSPELPIPVYNLGVSLQGQGRETEAIAEYYRAIALNPDLMEAQLRLAGLLLESGQRDEALALFERASRQQPGSVFGNLCLAALEFEKGHMDVAEEVLRGVLAIEPENADVLCRLGSVLTRRGSFVEAVHCFARAIAVDPGRAEAYGGLADAKKMTAGDSSILQGMLSQLEHGKLAPKDRARLHFAVAKAFDDIGDYKSAMRHYDDGNDIEARRLKAIGRTIDLEEYAAAVEQSINTFTPEFFARLGTIGSSSELPLLIVGMPRSGTTLVEQILSSHPDVAAGGELTFWGNKTADLAAQGLFTCSAAAIAQIAAEYLNALRSIGPDALRVTDKMPQNHLHLGLIHLIFPRARVIHCRRNPIDTCLSIYFTHFGQLQDFAFERSQIVFVYKHYEKIMADWRKVLPTDRMLEIDYERLVTDPEPLIREIVAFCDLAWDDACLRPELNQRTITTASMRQARQPVYTSSAGRWRHYEPWLREFAELKSPAVAE